MAASRNGRRTYKARRANDQKQSDAVAPISASGSIPETLIAGAPPTSGNIDLLTGDSSSADATATDDNLFGDLISDNFDPQLGSLEAPTTDTATAAVSLTDPATVINPNTTHAGASGGAGPGAAAAASQTTNGTRAPRVVKRGNDLSTPIVSGGGLLLSAYAAGPVVSTATAATNHGAGAAGVSPPPPGGRAGTPQPTGARNKDEKTPLKQSVAQEFSGLSPKEKIQTLHILTDKLLKGARLSKDQKEILSSAYGENEAANLIAESYRHRYPKMYMFFISRLAISMVLEIPFFLYSISTAGGGLKKLSEVILQPLFGLMLSDSTADALGTTGAALDLVSNLFGFDMVTDANVLITQYAEDKYFRGQVNGYVATLTHQIKNRYNKLKGSPLKEGCMLLLDIFVNQPAIIIHNTTGGEADLEGLSKDFLGTGISFKTKVGGVLYFTFIYYDQFVTPDYYAGLNRHLGLEVDNKSKKLSYHDESINNEEATAILINTDALSAAVMRLITDKGNETSLSYTFSLEKLKENSLVCKLADGSGIARAMHVGYSAATAVGMRTLAFAYLQPLAETTIGFWYPLQAVVGYIAWHTFASRFFPVFDKSYQAKADLEKLLHQAAKNAKERGANATPSEEQADADAIISFLVNFCVQQGLLDPTESDTNALVIAMLENSFDMKRMIATLAQSLRGSISYWTAFKAEIGNILQGTGRTIGFALVGYFIAPEVMLFKVLGTTVCATLGATWYYKAVNPTRSDKVVLEGLQTVVTDSKKARAASKKVAMPGEEKAAPPLAAAGSAIDNHHQSDLKADAQIPGVVDASARNTKSTCSTILSGLRSATETTIGYAAGIGSTLTRAISPLQFAASVGTACGLPQTVSVPVAAAITLESCAANIAFVGPKNLNAVRTTPANLYHYLSWLVSSALSCRARKPKLPDLKDEKLQEVFVQEQSVATTRTTAYGTETEIPLAPTGKPARNTNTNCCARLYARIKGNHDYATVPTTSSASASPVI